MNEPSTDFDGPRGRPLTSFCLREAFVLDEHGEFGGPTDVLVRDGRVEAVGPRLPGDESREVDFSGLFVMPGLIDCHLHLTGTTRFEDVHKTPLTLWALLSGVAARLTLEAGITTARDLGGADLGLRRAIELEVVEGPELQLALSLVSQTGGHADGYVAAEGRERRGGTPRYPGSPPYLADGVDAMRTVVRQLLRGGADWIKLCTTGGIASDFDDPEAPELTFEEIRVAVEEAARRGRRVATHAYGGEGLDAAVRAGVATIEHGTFLTEAQAAEMARRGTWLVPTLTCLRDDVAQAEDGAMPDHRAEKARRVGRALDDVVGVARAAGVPIAMGSDACLPWHHGRNAAEVTALHEHGLSPREAILAATDGGARLLGLDHELGRIAPGRRFDAIVLDVDPSDTRAFADPGAVRGVFKHGRPVVAHERFPLAG